MFPLRAPHEGTLLLRHKRFLAEVELDGVGAVTAHCPNSGSMLGMSEAGMPVRLSHDESPARKLAYTLELVSPDGGRTWVGCNTMCPNQVVRTLLERGAVPGIAAGPVEREVRLGAHSRIDFRADGHWVEVKNTTLAVPDRAGGLVARFPDAVTERGAKHLRALAARARKGEPATMLYFVNRGDCSAFGLAEGIDPEYARAFRAARRAGVRMLALGMDVRPDGWRVRGELPVLD